MRRRRAPAPSTSAIEPFRGTFFGRDAEIEAAFARIAEGARLVTLLGPGGVGKTRLLHRLLARLEDRFDATVFCDLSSAKTRDEVVALTAASLGGIALGAATTAETAVRRVGAALSKRGALLFAADNLEQLDDAALPVLATWLGAAPRLVVLATSRVRLGVPGEVIHRVLPLPPEEAMLLFVDRARAARGELSTAERDVARRIVALLEGMPLALEMAATRLAVLGPDELLARLSRPLAVLQSGARTDPDRHASLSRVLDGSWELLPQSARRALAELGVFAGGFTVGAAEAVLGLEPAGIVENIARLVDSSLVRSSTSRSQRTRHALYEVVREYALERLASEGRADETRSRHAEHFATWGESRLERMRLRGEAEAALVELIDDEANLAAAAAFAAKSPALRRVRLRLLLVLESVRMLRGALDVWASELESALAGEREGLVPLLARVELALARALHELGRTEAACAAYERVAVTARTIGDASLEGTALCGLGRLVVSLGEWERGLSLFKEARAIHGTSPAVHALAAACHAFYGLESGASREVSPIVAEYVEVCRRGGDPRELAFWLVQIGRTETELDRAPAAAEAHMMEGLALARRLGDLRGEGFALFGLGTHYIGWDRTDDSVPMLREAARLLREAGTRRYEAWAVGFLASALSVQGDLEGARDAYDDALRGLAEVGDAPREALVTAFRGGVHALLGDATRARADFAHARALAPATSIYHAWTIDLCEAQLDVLDARAAASAEDVARHVAKARGLLERAGWPRGGTRDARPWPWGGDFFEPRIAASLLEAQLDDVETPTAALRVAADGSSFVLPGRGQPVVAIEGREKVRRVLAALASARSARPGAAVGVEELMNAAWPGERVRRDAAQNRVHVALDALRKLGLRALLLRGERGWLFDPSVPFAWLGTSSGN